LGTTFSKKLVIREDLWKERHAVHVITQVNNHCIDSNSSRDGGS